MKQLIITLLLMFGAMQSQAFIETAIKSEIIAAEVTRAIEENNKADVLKSSVQLVYVWDGSAIGRKCDCGSDYEYKDSIGLPCGDTHRPYCPLHKCVKSSQTIIVPAFEFNLIDAIRDDSEGTLVTAYKMSGSPLYVYLKRVKFEEPTKAPSSFSWGNFFVVCIIIAIFIGIFVLILSGKTA